MLLTDEIDSDLRPFYWMVFDYLPTCQNFQELRGVVSAHHLRGTLVIQCIEYGGALALGQLSMSAKKLPFSSQYTLTSVSPWTSELTIVRVGVSA